MKKGKSAIHVRVRGAIGALLLFTIQGPAIARATELMPVLAADLSAQKDPDFSPLLNRWAKLYGASAVAPLLRLAASASLAEPERYIALMGVASLGGNASARELHVFLSDPSWMLRSAALQAVRALGDTSAGEPALALLFDPALVVRREAVETVARLRPAGAASALIKTIYAEENYHEGRAIWVPQAALRALVSLKAQGVARDLRPLLLRFEDPALQREAVNTLEILTGRTLADARSPVSAQALEWEKYLRTQSASSYRVGEQSPPSSTPAVSQKTL
jgi:HEAT repeat protein